MKKDNKIVENKKLVGKFIIVKDINLSDFMKDENGKIKTYEDIDDAKTICSMYEFEEALILEIKYKYIEK